MAQTSTATKFTTVRSLLNALARTMNLINPEMENHHQQTAYLAYQTGAEMGLGTEDLHMIVVASLLHDLGTIVKPQKENLSQIESRRREVAHIGAEMIRDLKQFRPVADVIELCQNSYLDNVRFAGTKEPLVTLDTIHGKTQVSMEQYIDVAGCIHLADIISASWDEGSGEILNQVSVYKKGVEAGRGTEFSDKVADAFLRLSDREYIWMDFALNPSFLTFFTGDMHDVDLEQTVELTQLASRIIDFRSAFTAMHSAGVAASARELARLAGMSEEDCRKMEIAGNLHDIGKLRVPNEILEKPGKLTDVEFNKVKEHTYYTRLILADVEGFEDIAGWAAYHHEKLNGRGYPFHLDGSRLDLGSRIMAVADIFSAITEERPYRRPMNREQAMKVMRENVERGGICGAIVKLLEENYDAVNDARMKKSREAGARYFMTYRPGGEDGASS